MQLLAIVVSFVEILKENTKASNLVTVNSYHFKINVTAKNMSSGIRCVYA